MELRVKEKVARAAAKRYGDLSSSSDDDGRGDDETASFAGISVAPSSAWAYTRPLFGST
jgi:hypothetical protein